jgi:hypothetical protein
MANIRPPMALLNVKMRVNSNPRNTGLELIMNDNRHRRRNELT